MFSLASLVFLMCSSKVFDMGFLYSCVGILIKTIYSNIISYTNSKLADSGGNLNFTLLGVIFKKGVYGVPKYFPRDFDSFRLSRRLASNPLVQELQEVMNNARA